MSTSPSLSHPISLRPGDRLISGSPIGDKTQKLAVLTVAGLQKVTPIGRDGASSQWITFLETHSWIAVGPQGSTLWSVVEGGYSYDPRVQNILLSGVMYQRAETRDVLAFGLHMRIISLTTYHPVKGGSPLVICEVHKGPRFAAIGTPYDLSSIRVL